MSPFEKLGIDEDFNPFYAENDIERPTDVQKKVIPKIMQGTSVVCIAQTGTGKTLGYALPISELVKQIEDEEGLSRKKSKPFAVIVAPTKELAVQIHQVFKGLSHHVKLRVRTLVGTSKTPLKTQSYEILIATPSKLARALKKGDVFFEQLKYLVFDEADNLFEMGFKKDIDGIMHFVDYGQTDTHFFSATMPNEIEIFLDEKFKKKQLQRITLSDAHSVQKRIETFNIFLQDHEKKTMLKMFLGKTAEGRGIIFCNQKNQVKEVAAYITEQLPKLKLKTLHGDLSEKERLANHKAFQNKKAQVLLATDVVARGIDVKDIKWVLNYNLPKTPIYYLHRGGRTARGGRSGMVYNFVTKFDTKIIAAINESIKKQSEMKMELIAKDYKEVKRKSAKKKKTKTKRIKITKRTKR